MNSVKLIVSALLVLACLAGSVMAGPVTIADYAGEFMKSTSSGLTRPSLSADGWNYMYSSTSSIGTQTSYANLLTTGYLLNKFWQYTIDGNWPSQVVGAEDMYIGASNTPTRNSGLTSDVYYAIAAYTIKADEAGEVRFANGDCVVYAAASNGIELRVYVDDTFKFSQVVAGGATYTFDNSLGTLAAGQTVYVAIGSNGNINSDDYELGYQLTIPEPASLALLGVGALALLRRRRN